MGILCILLDAMDFIPVILIGLILFHDIELSLLYIFVLSILRQYSGGWHASTIPACILSYLGVYIIYRVILILALPSIVLFASCILFLIYAVCCSPIEIPGNPLKTSEILDSKKKTVFFYCLAILCSFLLQFITIKLSKAILTAVIINSCLMLALQLSKKKKGLPAYEYQSHSNR